MELQDLTRTERVRLVNMLLRAEALLGDLITHVLEDGRQIPDSKWKDIPVGLEAISRCVHKFGFEDAALDILDASEVIYSFDLDEISRVKKVRRLCRFIATEIDPNILKR